MRIGDVELKWLGNSGFFIKNSKVIYIDPYQVRGSFEKADLILITHSHYDHCSVEDIEKVVKEGTTIVLPADCQSKITRLKIPVKLVVIEPGQEFIINDLKITAFPAYNVDKEFHPKEEDWVSYLIKINDILIYHSGDTDVVSEMQKLTGHKHNGIKFVALLAVGGRFTMNPEEAVEAVKVIKPDIAIPMHYGSIVGDSEDAKEFVDLCKENGFDARVLEKE